MSATRQNVLAVQCGELCPHASVALHRSVNDGSSLRAGKFSATPGAGPSGSHSHWERLSTPVLITITGVKSGNVYRECVQTYLEDIELPVTESLNSQTAARIRDNTLDADGIHCIKYRTKARCSHLSKELVRVQQLLVRVQQLIEYLKPNMGIDIAYDHDSDVVILHCGKFIPEPSGECAVLAFGKI